MAGAAVVYLHCYAICDGKRRRIELLVRCLGAVLLLVLLALFTRFVVPQRALLTTLAICAYFFVHQPIGCHQLRPPIGRDDCFRIDHGRSIHL